MHSPPANDYPVNWSSWIQRWVDHTASSPHLEPRTPPPASVKLGTLKELEKPVEYVECTGSSDGQLPVAVRQLYRDIYDLAVEREGFIPASLKAPLSEHLPRARPRYFSQDGHWEPDGGKRELEALLEIRDEALLCRSTNASEAAWNSDVHSPLLKLALRPFKEPLIRRHVLTSTRINSAFVPPMKEGSFYDKVGSKMVDYGIALHPDEDSPLGQAIHCALRPLPSSKQYLNQAAYDPIKYAANVVSIETKTGSGGLQEARSQLGIWIASWNFRMHQLLHEKRPSREASVPQVLIPVPVIVVIEHMWKLSFACDSSHRIVSCEPTPNSRCE